VICAEQPIHHRRLMLLDATDLCERSSQIAIEPRCGVRKPQCLGLRSIHRDHAHARECIVIQFADRLARYFTPCEALLIDRAAAICEERERHGYLQLRCARATNQACLPVVPATHT
jgi:hypothetical protein